MENAIGTPGFCCLHSKILRYSIRFVPISGMNGSR